MDSDGGTSADDYCGYHGNFGPQTTTEVILYGNEPLETTGCDAGQAPNGSLVVDGAINVLSHEIIETITDPVDPPAWNDHQGYEIADICADSYGTPLGSTDPSNPDRTQYNQVINGGKYYTQTEFSNAAYAKFGVGNGCQQSRVGAQKPAAGVARIVISSQAYPASLPADGRATAADEISIWDKPTDNGIRGDSVSVSSYVVDGDGGCGTLRKTRGTTDAYGSLDVTYVASTDDVICALVATEAKGGKSSTALVYQGSMRAIAPTASDTFPTTLRAGGTSLFTVTFGNRTGEAVPFGTVDFDIFPAKNNSPNVTAAQVRLAASNRAATARSPRSGSTARRSTTGRSRDLRAVRQGVDDSRTREDDRDLPVGARRERAEPGRDAGAELRGVSRAAQPGDRQRQHARRSRRGHRIAVRR